MVRVRAGDGGDGGEWMVRVRTIFRRTVRMGRVMGKDGEGEGEVAW